MRFSGWEPSRWEPCGSHVPNMHQGRIDKKQRWRRSEAWRCGGKKRHLYGKKCFKTLLINLYIEIRFISHGLAAHLVFSGYIIPERSILFCTPRVLWLHMEDLFQKKKIVNSFLLIWKLFYGCAIHLLILWKPVSIILLRFSKPKFKKTKLLALCKLWSLAWLCFYSKYNLKEFHSVQSWKMLLIFFVMAKKQEIFWLKVRSGWQGFFVGGVGDPRELIVIYTIKY